MTIKKTLMLWISMLTSSISYTQYEQKTIILWDIHHVILYPDTTQRFKLILNYRRPVGFSLLGKITKLAYKKLFSHGISSEHFVYEAQHYDPQFVELIKKIGNAQQPISGTVEIIKELHAHGYINHVGSNIGQAIFIDLIDANKNPTLAPIFTEYFELGKSQTVRYNDAHIIRKPKKEYFEDYLKRNQIDLSKTRVIFIDNDLSNVKTAQQVGICALHFTSPQQLRHDLQTQGINLT